MVVSRRALLAGAVILGAGAVGLALRPLRTNERSEGLQPLKLPQLIDARAQGKSFSLDIQSGRTQFFPGRWSSTLGYNGAYLGPTIRVRRGDSIQAAVRNSLDEVTTVHWHGLLVAGPLDGGPHQPIAPGETWRPLLPIDQPAATLFYHAHLHGTTAEQVYRGLAGLLIVQDDDEQRLGLPNEYGVDDLPLVLQDRQFETGILVAPSSMMTMMQGRRGDTILVNGTPNALARVPSRQVRLRLVNGSNARIYDLSFDDKRAFHWIATEGGLLDRPVELRSIRLAPGQRAELLVDFSDGKSAGLLTAADPNLTGMGMMQMSGPDAAAGRAFLHFQPIAGTSALVRLPARLSSRLPDAPVAGGKRRKFVLEMTMGGMMGGQPNGAMGSMGAGMGSLAINGRTFDIGRTDERVRLSDREIWEVSGQMMAHPFHVHGVHFQVLSRNGGPPDVLDQGLRDTILVKEPTELLVHFTKPTQGTAYMYHCHILEHEDNGMMGQFSVE
jgi:blue copper oxidase